MSDPGTTSWQLDTVSSQRQLSMTLFNNSRILTEYQKLENGNIKVKNLKEVVDASRLISSNHEDMGCLLIQWFDLLVQSLRAANVLESSYETGLFDDEKGAMSLLSYGEDKCFGFSFPNKFELPSSIQADSKYGWARLDEEASDEEVSNVADNLTDGSKVLAQRFKRVKLQSFWDLLKESPDMTMQAAESFVSWFLHGAYCSLVITKEVKKILPAKLRAELDDCKTLGKLVNGINEKARLVLANEVVSTLHNLAEVATTGNEKHPPEHAMKQCQKMQFFFEFMESHPVLYQRAFLLLFAQNVLGNNRFNSTNASVAEITSKYLSGYQDIMNWSAEDDEESLCCSMQSKIKSVAQKSSTAPTPASAAPVPSTTVSCSSGSSNPSSASTHHGSSTHSNTGTKRTSDILSPNGEGTGGSTKKKKEDWLDDDVLKNLRRRMDLGGRFSRREREMIRNNIGAFKFNLTKLKKEYLQDHPNEEREFSKRNGFDRVIDIMLPIDEEDEYYH